MTKDWVLTVISFAAGLWLSQTSKYCTKDYHQIYYSLSQAQSLGFASGCMHVFICVMVPGKKKTQDLHSLLPNVVTNVNLALGPV